MDGSTVGGNLKEQIFGIGTSCIHSRFVQGEIWCKILRLASGKVLINQKKLMVTLNSLYEWSCSHLKLK